MSEVMSNAIDKQTAYVIPFDQLRMADVPIVGGKNASLGEMISQLQGQGVRVPDGFATTAKAFRDFMAYGAESGETLAQRIEKRLAGTDIDDVWALSEAGTEIRQWIVDAPFQPELEKAILDSYFAMVRSVSNVDISVAVRSS